MSDDGKVSAIELLFYLKKMVQLVDSAVLAANVADGSDITGKEYTAWDAAWNAAWTTICSDENVQKNAWQDTEREFHRLINLEGEYGQVHNS